MTAICKIAFLLFVSTITLTAQNNSDNINLHYGNDRQQNLDLFLPESYNTETPVLIMLHGGAWSLGGKEYTDKTSKDLRDRGIIVANVDYRYVSETINATHLLQDIDDAVSYLQSISKEKGFNANKISIAGVSAGAHLALLYGYNTTKRNITSISALCAPSKFDDPSVYAHIQKLGLVKIISLLADDVYSANNKGKKISDISPYNKVSNVPTLLVHGTNDDLVDYQQSVDLYNKLQNNKIKSKLVTMQGDGHDVGMNQPESEKKVLDEIYNWIKIHK